MDEDTEKIVADVVKGVAPVIGSALATAVVGEVLEKLSELVVSNVNESDMSGDKEVHPTKEDSSLQKGEANADRNNAALAKDEVSAQSGSIDAAETEAKASTSEATAAEAGASAVRTKAGASDIETKALKMM